MEPILYQGIAELPEQNRSKLSKTQPQGGYRKHFNDFGLPIRILCDTDGKWINVGEIIAATCFDKYVLKRISTSCEYGLHFVPVKMGAALNFESS
eukprot:1916310-Rhodomonas_salina.1